MARDLPTELLREILSPPLLVPDEMFADTGAVSPFSRVDRSASDVLLVCKSWMRAATPWLYSTVIVRSMAQAKALALALTNNPDFGKFIRRLRVEGAYAEYIWVVVKTAPNITDLCMTVAVWSDVSSAGLIKSLAHIDPRRVILTLAPEKPIKNKNHKAILSALCTQVQSWTRLTIFKFAGTGISVDRWMQIPDFVAFPSIITALCTSSSLEEVQLTFTRSSDITDDILDQLLRDNTGRKVRLCQSSRVNDDLFENQVQQVRARTSPQDRPRILTDSQSINCKNLLELATLSTPMSLHPMSGDECASLPNPFYKPLGYIKSPARHAILTRIFQHAVAVESPAQPTHLGLGGDWFDPRRFNTAVARVLLAVSQEFEDIATEILIKYVSIDHEARATGMLEIISAKPSLSARMKTMQFTHLCPPTPAHIELLEKSSHLVAASIPLSQAAIDALVRGGSSNTLRKLDLLLSYLAPSSTQPLDLDEFLALEELSINRPSYIPYSTNTGVFRDQSRALPRLRRLDFKSAPQDIVDSLTDYDLPQLDHLDCSSGNIDTAALKSFVKRHGARIREARLHDIPTVLWDILPEMVELHWTHSAPDITSAIETFAPNGHAKLRILRISAELPSATQRRKNADLIATWTILLTDIVTRLRFPALELVQVVEGYAMWPVNEREAKKSIWPALAETLERQSINLTDHEGRGWRRRLQ